MADLHADFGERLVINTAAMPWEPSPSPTVWRKRLERLGPAEGGRVTSVVRYDAGATFPAHEHPGGEEIFVLDGVFADERGEFPAGTYMLNPEGFRHAPRSPSGCTLFVKLRQYDGPGRVPVLLETSSCTWLSDRAFGARRLPLYDSPEHGEHMDLLRLGPASSLGRCWYERGVEIFVLSGFLVDEHGVYPRGSWIRMPRRSAHHPRSDVGCTLYVKRGGFPPA